MISPLGLSQTNQKQIFKEVVNYKHNLSEILDYFKLAPDLGYGIKVASLISIVKDNLSEILDYFKLAPDLGYGIKVGILISIAKDNLDFNHDKNRIDRLITLNYTRLSKNVDHTIAESITNTCEKNNLNLRDDPERIDNIIKNTLDVLDYIGKKANLSEPNKLSIIQIFNNANLNLLQHKEKIDAMLAIDSKLIPQNYKYKVNKLACLCDIPKKEFLIELGDKDFPIEKIAFIAHNESLQVTDLHQNKLNDGTIKPENIIKELFSESQEATFDHFKKNLTNQSDKEDLVTIVAQLREDQILIPDVKNNQIFISDVKDNKANKFLLASVEYFGRDIGDINHMVNAIKDVQKIDKLAYLLHPAASLLTKDDYISLSKKNDDYANELSRLFNNENYDYNKQTLQRLLNGLTLEEPTDINYLKKSHNLYALNNKDLLEANKVLKSNIDAPLNASFLPNLANSWIRKTPAQKEIRDALSEFITVIHRRERELILNDAKQSIYQEVYHNITALEWIHWGASYMLYSNPIVSSPTVTENIFDIEKHVYLGDKSKSLLNKNYTDIINQRGNCFALALIENLRLRSLDLEYENQYIGDVVEVLNRVCDWYNDGADVNRINFWIPKKGEVEGDDEKKPGYILNARNEPVDLLKARDVERIISYMTALQNTIAVVDTLNKESDRKIEYQGQDFTLIQNSDIGGTKKGDLVKVLDVKNFNHDDMSLEGALRAIVQPGMIINLSASSNQSGHATSVYMNQNKQIFLRF